MASQPAGGMLNSFAWGRWLTGAVTGAIAAAVAALVLYSFGTFEVSDVGVETLGILIMPGAAFGLLYAAIASIDRVSTLSQRPGFGLVVGLGFGILFWLTTVIGQSFNLSGLLAGLTFGGVIGVLYALSPFIE